MIGLRGTVTATFSHASSLTRSLHYCLFFVSRRQTQNTTFQLVLCRECPSFDIPLADDSCTPVYDLISSTSSRRTSPSSPSPPH